MKQHGFWMALAAVAVCGEVYAIKTRKIPTVSAETRVTFGVDKPWHTVGQGFYLGLVAWFWFHLFRKAERVIEKAVSE